MERLVNNVFGAFVFEYHLIIYDEALMKGLQESTMSFYKIKSWIAYLNEPVLIEEPSIEESIASSPISAIDPSLKRYEQKIYEVGMIVFTCSVITTFDFSKMSPFLLALGIYFFLLFVVLKNRLSLRSRYASVNRYRTRNVVIIVTLIIAEIVTYFSIVIGYHENMHI